MASEEIWKDVVGYEGIYQVSNRGRVMRIAPGPGAVVGRILKPMGGGNGYLRVGLWRDRKRTHLFVHRLVIEAHIGPAPSPDHEVNHKNGITDDNRVENLEWVTRSENERHAYRVLGRKAAPSKGEAHGLAKLSDEDVIGMRKLYATGKYTQAELGEMFGVSESNIGLIVRREIWKHIGGPPAPETDRHARGETHGRAKVTRQEVIEIRTLYATGDYTQAELGRIFGVKQSTIGRIVNRDTWQHLP